MLTVEEVTDVAGLSALGEEWRALVDAAEEVTPFQTFEWVEPFWRHCGRGRLWVLLAREQGHLVAVMPLFVARMRALLARRVAFIGEPGADYQNVIARAGRVDECRDAFLDYLLTHRDRWDVLDLEHLREGTTLTRTARRRGAVLRLVPHRTCPATALPATWGEMSSALGKNLRANIGRRRRQLGREFQMELTTVSAPQIDEAMAAMYELHSKRWQRRGRAGYFAEDAMRACHREIAHGFARRGWLRLHQLRLDGQIRAVSYCFRFGKSVMYHNGGFDLELSRYSPGMVLMSYAIEQAIGEGAREFDFTRGDETYKRDWKPAPHTSYRLLVGRRAPLSLLAFLWAWAESAAVPLATSAMNAIWGRRSALNRLRELLRGRRKGAQGDGAQPEATPSVPERPATPARAKAPYPPPGAPPRKGKRDAAAPNNNTPTI